MDWRVALRRVGPWLEAIFVAIIVVWMLQVRLLPYGAFAQKNTLIDSDSYYHFRAAWTAAQDFPHSLRFDPWTYFPNGTATGQFGTLYDLIIAAAIILTGNPADKFHALHVVQQVAPYFGAATAIPVYLLARRMGGRIAAVWSVGILGLLPGEIFLRSLAGYADHDVAEVLFSSIALLGVLWAVESGRRFGEVPWWRAFAPAILGAVGLLCYLWVWPPGVMVVALLGLWIVLEMLLDHTKGRPTRGLAFAVGITFGLAAVLFLPLVERISFDFNLFSVLQPVSLLSVAAAALIINAISEWSDARKANRWFLPAGAGVLVVLSFVVVSLFVPSLYAVLKWGFSWVTGIGATQNFLTIQEAAPSCNWYTEAWPFCAKFQADYGWMLYGALIAVPFLVWEIARRRKPGDFLLLFWFLFMLIAATNRLVFNEYLAVPVAVANGWLLAYAARATGLTDAVVGRVHPPEAQKRRSGRRVRSGTSAPDFKAYQPVAVIAVGLLVLPGLVLSANPTAPYWVVVGEMRPDSSTVLWDIASEWVANNTPAVPLDFKTAYPFQNAGNFHYPNGTYGILAWWDYGHQIEIFGNRPPVANDFQQAAPFASLFFTDTHEWETEPAMAKWTGGDAYKIRYVMISDQDANGKYGAITVWANLNNESRHQFEQGQTVSTGCFTGATIVSRACTSSDTSAGGHSVQLLGPEYRNSMMYRLYYENGDDLAHYRMVYAYPGWNCYGTYIDSSGNLVTFNDQLLQGPCNGQGLAPQTLSRSSSNVQGGGSGQPLIYDFVDEPSLKIFEHVRGVTLLGNATPGTSVTASLALHLPWSASNIPINESYTQTVTTPSNGTWVMTVPYSTCSATKACLTPAENGTTLQVTTGAAYAITAGSSIFNASVTDRQVIYGAKMWVS